MCGEFACLLRVHDGAVQMEKQAKGAPIKEKGQRSAMRLCGLGLQ
jgi:hypothetical protein